jgi:hypothetical protein
MQKSIVMLFIGILMVMILSSGVKAVDCEECQEFYRALVDMGYDSDECKQGTIDQYPECYECFYGKPDYSGSSDSGGGVCIITPFCISILCCVSIIYYGKKRNMKNKR